MDRTWHSGFIQRLTLFIQIVGVDDAGQYMCIIIAGSEVNTTYVIDSMNTAYVYLFVKCKLEIIYFSTIVIESDQIVHKSY